MNQSLCPVNIYLDLSKTFDSLKYDILMSKLKFYGLQSKALQLLKSYLSDRSQYVQIDNVKSNLHSVSCGIPQGSVMGPILFNIFINDIINATTKFTLIMYADDTTLVSHLENFGATNIEIEREINKEILKVNTRLLSNKLVLNVAKSKFMLFFKHPKIDDQYLIQLYKLYYKNTNNLFPSYFNSFTPYYNNEEYSHNLRSMTLRLPMTRREFFVQSTKYQLLKLVRETSVIDLNRTVSSTIYQFSAFFKYSIINRYDPICTIDHCYVCG